MVIIPLILPVEEGVKVTKTSRLEPAAIEASAGSTVKSVLS
jgi:hypothetical protein